MPDKPVRYDRDRGASNDLSVSRAYHQAGGDAENSPGGNPPTHKCARVSQAKLLKKYDKFSIVHVLFVLFLTFLGGFVPGEGRVMGQTSDLSDLTAAFVCRISQFVTWPDSSFPSEQGNFHICVEGKDPLKIALSLENKAGAIKVHNKKVVVKQIKNGKELRNLINTGLCHVLVITSQDWTGPELASGSDGVRNLLLIGGTTDFVRDGGMLGLILKKGRILIYANKEAIQKSRLRFDSRLMMLVREP